MYKTPEFWNGKNFINYILYPISFLYSLIVQLRLKLIKPEKFDIKIICIGNVTAGGAGKTPLSIALAEYLIKEQGANLAFVSRGYGSKIKDSIKIEKDSDNKNAGDEPLLLAKISPVYVGSNRKKSINMAINDGYEIVIMDDGYQNPKIYKDVNILVVNTDYGMKNNMIFPAGPLRETLTNAFTRTDFSIVFGSNLEVMEEFEKPKLLANIKCKNLCEIDLKSKYIAFAAIANPEKFFDSLVENNIKVCEKISFADHHQYSNIDIEKLIKKADKKGYKLITTAKDAVKIPIKYLNKIVIFEIEIKFKDYQLFKQTVDDIIL